MQSVNTWSKFKILEIIFEALELTAKASIFSSSELLLILLLSDLKYGFILEWKSSKALPQLERHMDTYKNFNRTFGTPIIICFLMKISLAIVSAYWLILFSKFSRWISGLYIIKDSFHLLEAILVRTVMCFEVDGVYTSLLNCLGDLRLKGLNPQCQVVLFLLQTRGHNWSPWDPFQLKIIWSDQ